ncbi:MAG: ATP-dependent Clp protease ATP-binding subunit [Myxococcota bacterium]
MQYERMTPEAQLAFADAHALASSLGHSTIELEHVMLALLGAQPSPLREGAEGDAPFLASLEQLQDKLSERLQEKEPPIDDLIRVQEPARYVAQALLLASEQALQEVERNGEDLVGPWHLVRAISRCAELSLRQLLSPLLRWQPSPVLPTPRPTKTPAVTEPRAGLDRAGDASPILRSARELPPLRASTPPTPSADETAALLLENTPEEPPPLEPVLREPVMREPAPQSPAPRDLAPRDLAPRDPPSRMPARDLPPAVTPTTPPEPPAPPEPRELLEPLEPEYDTAESAPPPSPEDSALARFTTDLTERARSGGLDPIVGRDQEIRRVIQVLSRRSKNNPVLIGEPGVGKTAIVEGLAQRMVHRDVPEGLRHQRLLSLDLGALLAGARYRGDFEERLKQLLAEIKEDAGVMLFIDELHTLMGAGGGEGAIDAANLLKPALARGELRCIGATTLEEYRRYVEKDAALERRFQPVTVAEPSVEDTLSILRGLKERYELHHGVRIQDRALVAAAQLSQRYLPDRFLPDKAIDLMDEAAARIRVELDSSPAALDLAERKLIQLEIERQALTREEDRHSLARLRELVEELANAREEVELLRAHWEEERAQISRLRELQEELGRNRLEADRALREQKLELYVSLEDERAELASHMTEVRELLETLQGRQRLLREEVSAEDIAEVVARWTGLPVTRMLEAEVDKLLRLEERLQARIVGQDEVLKRVAAAIRRSRAGLNEPDRPLGSFLFLGPTGVGKTETARVLAELLYQDPRALLRLDMSEFMEKQSVARLLGSPPGYVGYEEGSILSKALRRRPWSVVLFDEVEKAHPDVFNLLLQVLEGGSLTDSQGRMVDFRNTLVILTSNLGSGEGATHETPHPRPHETLHETPEQVKARALKAAKGFFRLELLNRLEELLVFKPLEARDAGTILELQLARLRTRLDARHLKLELTDAAKARLLEAGFDAQWGARPLGRVVQRVLKDPLATLLLQDPQLEGVSWVADVDPEGEGLRLWRRKNG